MHGSIGVINEELKVLNLAYQEKAKQILRDNPVYNDVVAGLREGEVVLPQDEIDVLREKFVGKQKNEQVLLDGKYIVDYRGKEFYHKDAELTGGKWVKGIIDLLGDGHDLGTFVEDLTPTELAEIREQEETERITALSASEKQTEFGHMKAGLAGKAQTLETTLKFDGDIDYQTKAQEFYNTELGKLKLLYGVK